MKFAYLIMAHNNPEQLRILLSSLDYIENEIYLHIDKKNDDINIQEMREQIKNAKIYIYKTFAVYWGDISQTQCQIFLLSEACKNYHDYYHLISGSDLPIKPHCKIVEFFTNNQGKQFVHFEENDFCKKKTCRYYHFFSSFIVREKSIIIKKVLSYIEKISLKIQKILKIDRQFYCGANWYSITHDLALDFLNKKDLLLNKVKWTISSDELVLQTFLRCYSTKTYDFYAITNMPSDYKPLMRSIDWLRGSPYTWKINDYKELMESDNLYARKFDITKDRKIIMEIIKQIR